VRASPTDNDTQDNKSINRWRAILAITRGPGKKLEAAERQLRPNLTNLRSELRRGFGSGAVGMLLPPNRENGEIAPIAGEPAGSAEAPRFGVDMTPNAIEVV
jgi:hypothetical protein